MRGQYGLLLTLPLLFILLVAASGIEDGLHVKRVEPNFLSTKSTSHILSLENPQVDSYIAKSGDSKTYSYQVPANTSHELLLASGPSGVTCRIGARRNQAAIIEYNNHIVLSKAETRRLTVPPVDHERTYFVTFYAHKENTNFHCRFTLLPDLEADAVANVESECVKSVLDIKLDVQYNFNLKTECNDIYRLIIPSDLPVYISLHVEINTSKYSIMYIKRNSIPTFSNYDNILYGKGGQQSLLGIVNKSDVYYFSFYSETEQNITWRINATSQNTCISNCSGESHGTCNSGQCNCTSDYVGVACEQMNRELLIGEYAFGELDQQSWNYYRFTSDAKLAIIQLRHLDRQDCDLFVANGRNPTINDFSLRNISFSPSSSITIEQPIGQTWHIGVLGISSCKYNLTVDTNNCPPFCVSPRGTCNPETYICKCSPGYYGDTCTKPAGNLTSENALDAILPAHSDEISFLYKPSNVVFTTLLKENASHPSLDVSIHLYNNNGTLINQWQERENDKGYSIHVINVLSKRSELPFLIVVKRNSYAADTDIPFKIVAWSPSL
ncbi:uncharacterized protein LOC126323772 [Schistocerca gregaria]|uniref:uncharacterized protein LOC126323772 n=1 Tax=Schistocerca gregaria TaxID=7010 RepID=UPI00211DBCC3|nr:uncharacterized protein LOC126323772 [Schistocerca gregaria]